MTFYSNFLNSTSAFKLFFMQTGVILFFPLFFASFPDIYTSSAVMYSKTAAKNIELPTPTLEPIITSFSLRLILPIGNNRPARDDLDFPPILNIFDFPPFPRSGFLSTLTTGLWLILSKDPVLFKACESFFFYLLWTGANTSGTGGGGILLSKRLSGTLATASIIVELL